MKSALFERFAGFSVPRILFFGILGVVLLMNPSFVLNGAFYAVVGYLSLAGVITAIHCVRLRKTRSGYASLTASAFLILFSLSSIYFAQYLVSIAPLYLGALFLAAGSIVAGLYAVIVYRLDQKTAARHIKGEETI